MFMYHLTVITHEQTGLVSFIILQFAYITGVSKKFNLIGSCFDGGNVVLIVVQCGAAQAG